MLKLCLTSSSYSQEPQNKNNMLYMDLVIKDKTRADWTEKKQPRPIKIKLLHSGPSDRAASPITIGHPKDPLFECGEGTRVSSVKELKIKAKKPLVLLSHGTGSQANQMLWIGSHLVKNGYIVAAVEHYGNSTAYQQDFPEAYLLWWERSLDMTKTLDWITKDSDLGAYIDQENIFMLGHSLGGYTAVSLAGGLTDIDKFNNFCKSPEADAICKPQPEFPQAQQKFEAIKSRPDIQSSLEKSSLSFQDKRIKAFIVLSPALGQSFKVASLSKIKSPFLVIAGSDDSSTPNDTNARYFAEKISNSTYYEIKDAGHYSFLASCSEKGLKILPLHCKEKAATSRKLIHKLASQQILNFLDHHQGI